MMAESAFRNLFVGQGLNHDCVRRNRIARAWLLNGAGLARSAF